MTRLAEDVSESRSQTLRAACTPDLGSHRTGKASNPDTLAEGEEELLRVRARRMTDVGARWVVCAHCRSSRMTIIRQWADGICETSKSISCAVCESMMWQ